MTRATEPADVPGAAVRLSAALPNLDRNGLARIASELVKDPRRMRLIVAVADVARIIDDLDSGTDTAVVRLLRIELVDEAKASRAWQTMLNDAREDTLDFGPGGPE